MVNKHFFFGGGGFKMLMTSWANSQRSHQQYFNDKAGWTLYPPLKRWLIFHNTPLALGQQASHRHYRHLCCYHTHFLHSWPAWRRTMRQPCAFSSSIQPPHNESPLALLIVPFIIDDGSLITFTWWSSPLIRCIVTEVLSKPPPKITTTNTTQYPCIFNGFAAWMEDNGHRGHKSCARSEQAYELKASVGFLHKR